MKHLYLKLIMCLCCIQAVAQDCYCLLYNYELALPQIVITDLYGNVKNITSFEKQGNYGGDIFSLAGLGQKIFCAGNVYDQQINQGQASVWTIALNGQIISFSLLGKKRSSELTTISSLAVYKNLLYCVGENKVDINATYGLFIVADLEGNTVYECSLNELDNPAKSRFTSVAVSEKYVFITGSIIQGVDSEIATLWIFDHHNNLLKTIPLSSMESDTNAVAIFDNQLYVCGSIDINAAIWLFDLQGNFMSLNTYPPSFYDNVEAYSMVFLDKKLVVSGTETDDEDNQYPVLWITTALGEVIFHKTFDQIVLDSQRVPLARSGAKLLYGLSETNLQGTEIIPELFVFNNEGELLEQNPLQPDITRASFVDIYIPNFNFLFKASSEFKPLKYQKGL